MQRTIEHEISCFGTGLHTGIASTLRFCAAPENYGIRFVRTDAPDMPEIPALVEYVVSTNRSTTLAVETNNGKLSVQTVEHVLAALAGMEIDNCRIEVDAPEVPILDGSALPFIEMLQRAGIREQNAKRRYYELSEPHDYKHLSQGAEIHAVPADTLSIDLTVEFTRVEALKRQTATLNTLRDFAREIAPARTFCLFSELELLVKQGLVRGGTLDNAVVVLDDARVVSSEAKEGQLTRLLEQLGLAERMEHRPTLGTTGYLNNTELRFPNEPARHKLLDFLGDLALLGMPLKAHISALRTGHQHNVEFVQQLRQKLISKQEE
jgi:UDP-3-O-[3-hydroxymyristoyl] N-acetylglucosamine deacetylase/3-hydroxyacyl-[acyl-carrier-protein] dehydratase